MGEWRKLVAGNISGWMGLLLEVNRVNGAKMKIHSNILAWWCSFDGNLISPMLLMILTGMMAPSPSGADLIPSKDRQARRCGRPAHWTAPACWKTLWTALWTELRPRPKEQRLCPISCYWSCLAKFETSSTSRGKSKLQGQSWDCRASSFEAKTEQPGQAQVSQLFLFQVKTEPLGQALDSQHNLFEAKTEPLGQAQSCHCSLSSKPKIISTRSLTHRRRGTASPHGPVPSHHYHPSL